MKTIVLAFIFTFSVGMLTAQTPHGLLRQGNKNYKKQEYTKAEEKYRKALNKKPSVKSNYNLGNAVYQQDRFKEAIKHYESSIAGTQDKKLKSDAHYNMGNAYMNSGEMDKAINSYKQALRLNPKDMDTKHNLTMALQQKRKQEQKKNKDKNKQDKKKKQQGNNDQQKKQEDQEGKQEQQQQQQQQQQPQDQKKDQKPEEGQGQELNKQEAKKLLQIMNDEERKVQEKLRRGKGTRKKSEKDW